MLKPSSWSATNVLVLLATLGAVTPGAEARVLEHRIDVDVAASGKVTERWNLKVAIETEEDVGDWKTYAIYLDDNRRLLGLDGAVILPSGERQKIGRKEQDLAQAAGGGILHSSARYQVIEPAHLPPGSVLQLGYSLETEPYWPGGILPLMPASEAIEGIQLSIQVDPAAGPLRFRLDGPAEGLSVESGPQSVLVRGSLPDPEPLPGLAGGGSVQEPVLRWAWGEAKSWESLGVWYNGLLRSVPQSTPEVQKLARELTAGATTPRAKLEALVAHVRRKVRYVAVEVGIGGYRPYPPAEVAKKLWGDCKDKSLLLIDLARAVGLEAWPVLIRLDESERIDREFPSPYQFNHAITAFAAGPLEPKPGDPVADGFFFIDPTQEIGQAGYLHQGVQDQDAVVVLADKGQLVRLPSQPETASRKLVVELKLAADGAASGRARVELEGDGAASMLQFLDAAASQSPLENVLRRLFEAALRGARLQGLVYNAGQGSLPRFEAAVLLDHPAYLEGLDRGGSLQAGGLRLFPEPRDVEKVAELKAAAPGSGRLEQIYLFELPAGLCPPEAKEEKTENAVGRFTTSLKVENGKVELKRVAELLRPWVEKADFPALQELAIAETRALQRRIRFGCKG